MTGDGDEPDGDDGAAPEIDGEDADSDAEQPPSAGEFGIADDVVQSSNDQHPGSDGSSDGDGLDTDATRDGGADGDAPLSSIASSVDQRREQRDDRPDELFSEESVPEIDTDVVWEQLDDEEPPELSESPEQEVRVVEKRSYCEQCPFFSAPPEVGCSHDGTEILELVDMDHFRVVDCPKVREDERLERL